MRASSLKAFVLAGLFATSPLSASDKPMTPEDTPPTLRQKIGQMIMVGFHATQPHAPQVQSLSRKIEDGLVGGG